MKKTNIIKPILLLTLLFGAMSAAGAEDRFYIDAVNIEPGETKTLAFNLDNSQEFYGFQADITLPEGVEIVMNGSKPDITLSSRTDASYNVVSNLLSSGAVRLGTFSTSHTPISGTSGALLYLKVSADDNFVGGTISLTDILFIDANDRDFQLPDFSIDLGTEHNNSFYIPDFKIAVGETKTVSIILDNETPFTAFQTDIYLPEGLTIEANSFVLSSRAAGTHTVSAKSFSDDRTRIACLSTGNDVFTGTTGDLLSFNITANKDVAETCQIELRNQIFSMSNAKEYTVPNSTTNVTTERALVESVTLNKTSLALVVGDSELLTTTVLPTYASTKDVSWSSQAPEIATVSPAGLVTAVGIGSTVIKVEAVDGSGKFDECTVTVSGIPVTGITLSQYTASVRESETLTLTATAAPSNASDKSVTWESLNPDYAEVADNGVVTAKKVGTATIEAKSVSNPEITAQCEITITPMPVSEIAINQSSVSLEVGETFNLTYTISPEKATNKDVVWSTDNDTVASISDEGKITAKALGTAHITATAADGFGAKAICTVVVVPTLATGIVINTPPSTEFKVGQTIELSADVTPENATDKSVTWSSNDTSIATVNNLGIVTAISEGEVVITATNSADITDEIALTVIPTLAESISVIPEDITLRAGDETTLIVSIIPTTTTNKNVVWASSAPEIANVDNQGKVTAYKVGEAVITVSTTDDSQKTAQCKVTVEPTPATGIKINYDGSKILYVGNTVNLTATVTPEDATDKSVTWRSQDESVVTVTPEGVVEARKVGQASISATNSAGQSDLINFTVAPTLVNSIILDETSLQLKVTETHKLNATVLPEDATDKSLTWESSQPSVATVSQDGTVTAISIGNTTITVKANDESNQSATCSVSVVPTPVESVTITAQGSTTLKAGQTVQLSAEVLPSTATDKTVSWTSSQHEVASVNSLGLVTAVSVGKTTITATAGDKSSTIEITVEKTLAESIELNRSTASLKVAGTIQLTARFTPETTTDKTVKWTSSDAGIATVSDNGLVTANTIGNCRITAVAQDGSNATAYCDITVGETTAESIKITPEGPFTLNYGEEVRLTATVLPKTTTDMSVTWSSQSSSVTVDQTGLVKAASAVENNWISATNSAGQTDYVYVTVLPLKVSNIELSQTSSQLKVNEELTLTATVLPANATDTSVRWSSTVPTVASVDSYGKVTALSIGDTDIEVIANDGSGVKAICHISVVPTPVESVTVTAQGSTTLKAMQTVLLQASIYPSNATIQTVTWSSENETIAKVNEYGLVTAVSVGSVDIIATADDKSDKVNITVEPTLIESLVITDTELNMEVGDNFKLTVWINPSTATNQNLQWSSQNPDIASVNDEGVVTAHALGETIVEVRATDGSGKGASIPVWVNPTPVSRIVIDYSGTTTLRVGDKLQLNVNVYPENATDKSYKWEVQRPELLSVSEDGLLEALAIGESWIRVVSNDGHANDITFYVVETPVERIDIEKDTDWCYAGETIQLTARVFPESATNNNVEWTSSDESILTVNQSGLVTAHLVGYADITAHAMDGSNVTASIRINVVATPADHIEITALGNTTLKDGESVQLVATVYPSTATHQSVAWSSDAEEIATVSESGLVTAGSVVGKTLIHATNSDGVSAAISITVEETPIKDIVLSIAPNTLYPGDGMEIHADIFPSNATVKDLIWSIQDEDIIIKEREENNPGFGKILYCKAQKPGTTTVMAKAENGVSGTIEIAVNPIKVNEIIFNSVPKTMFVGAKEKMDVSVLPENATNKSLIWVYDTEIISIDESLEVSALKAGSTEVVAYPADGSSINASFTLDVVQLVTSISLNEHDLILDPSTTFELIASIEPIDATNKSVRWDSSNPSVADVDDYGVISTNEEGDAFITVSTMDGSSLSDECHIKVQKQGEGGVDIINIDDVNITISDANIQIKDLSVGTKVYLFGVDGILYKSTVAKGDNISFDINSSQCYILKIGNNTLKIASKQL